jgi:hypothetical protein
MAAVLIGPTTNRPVAEASTCTTHNTHKRQTYMLHAGQEPAIPVNKRLQNQALDRTATGIGNLKHLATPNLMCVHNPCGYKDKRAYGTMSARSYL